MPVAGERRASREGRAGRKTESFRQNRYQSQMGDTILSFFDQGDEPRFNTLDIVFHGKAQKPGTWKFTNQVRTLACTAVPACLVAANRAFPGENVILGRTLVTMSCSLCLHARTSSSRGKARFAFAASCCAVSVDCTKGYQRCNCILLLCVKIGNVRDVVFTESKLSFI